MVYDRKYEKIYFWNSKTKVVGNRTLIMTRHFSGAGKIAPGNFRAGPALVPIPPIGIPFKGPIGFLYALGIPFKGPTVPVAHWLSGPVGCPEPKYMVPRCVALRQSRNATQMDLQILLG